MINIPSLSRTSNLIANCWLSNYRPCHAISWSCLMNRSTTHNLFHHICQWSNEYLIVISKSIWHSSANDVSHGRLLSTASGSLCPSRMVLGSFVFWITFLSWLLENDSKHFSWYCWTACSISAFSSSGRSSIVNIVALHVEDCGPTKRAKKRVDTKTCSCAQHAWRPRGDPCEQRAWDP